MLRPSAATINNILTGAPWLWKIINNVPFLHRAAMLYIYTSKIKLHKAIALSYFTTTDEL